jgi:hypothetical protein
MRLRAYTKQLRYKRKLYKTKVFEIYLYFLKGLQVNVPVVHILYTCPEVSMSSNPQTKTMQLDAVSVYKITVAELFRIVSKSMMMKLGEMHTVL